MRIHGTVEAILKKMRSDGFLTNRASQNRVRLTTLLGNESRPLNPGCLIESSFKISQGSEIHLMMVHYGKLSIM